MKYSSSKLLAVLVTLILFSIYGFQAASANLHEEFVGLTVPTRTPIPQPTEVPKEPTKDQGNNNSGGDNSSPQPTAIPPTATPVPVTLAPTPVDGFVRPTRCGDPFFVATLGTINVRSQPNTESEIVAKMVYLEARQVLGRWSQDSWWQILLPDTSIGWVFDGAGSMIGVMEVVPLINADGSPASDPIWQPTPDLVCPTLAPTEIPTEAPTATAVPNTPTPRPTAAQRTVAPSSNDDSGVASGGSADPAPTIPVTIDPNVISALPESSESAIEPEAIIIDRESTQKQEAPTSITSGQSTASYATPLVRWPIILGICLILFGVGTLIIQRRKEILE